MADPDKISILLADGDALRRDGLAAVLQNGNQFEVVAQCADGASALDRIRQMRPDVAVVDLNVPEIHGIELIRRIRAEGLNTKIVILSGSADDDIIREVVRAGGDAYLLKNGPARHLIDAISYVRDGGQYFSPQLKRDGLDRQLLEEASRVPRGESAVDERDTADGYQQPSDRSPRERIYYGRPAQKRVVAPRRIRERMRDDGSAGNLGDRDYEILEQMADGIRPILDRLEEIEGRVNGMESGDEPVPQDVGGWLTRQMSDTFRGPDGGHQEMALGRTMQDLEARLPQMIEQAVTSRFQQMAEKLQDEIEETHIRTLETFVKNIQVKLVSRVSALETDMTKQAEAMHQLREYSQRTEDNLSRLISGVDKLAQELPARLASQHLYPDGESPAPEQQPRRRHSSSAPFSPKKVWAGIVVLALVVAGGMFLMRGSKNKTGAAGDSKAAASTRPVNEKPIVLSGSADTKARIDAASQYVERKDYTTAEDIFQQVLQADPANPDALKGLASVLYRQDKIEESAAILDKLK